MMATCPQRCTTLLSTVKTLQRAFRGRLFGATDTTAGALGCGFRLCEPTAHVELLLVIAAAGVQQLILREWQPPRLKVLLQSRFRVLIELDILQRSQALTQDLQDEAPAGLQPPINKNGAGQRFKRIGENGFTAVPSAFEFSRPKGEIVTKIELASHCRQGLALDHFRAHPAQRALASTWKCAVQMLRDQVIENGIAQKFQPLIVVATHAAMSQRL